MSSNPQPQASTPSIRGSDALVGGGGDDGRRDGRNEGKCLVPGFGRSGSALTVDRRPTTP